MAFFDTLNAYYSFNEASGNAIDEFAAFDLTDNATVGRTTGIQGNAALFAAASSEFFSLTDNATFSGSDRSFTFLIWANLATTGADRYILAKGVSNATANLEYRLFYQNSSGRVAFGMSNGTTSAAAVGAASAISTGAWVAIEFWHDHLNDLVGGRVNRGTAVTAALTGGPQNTAGAFRIGASAAGANFWDGSLDECSFHEGLLDSAVLDDWYNAGVGRSYSYWSSGGVAIPRIMHHYRQQGIS